MKKKSSSTCNSPARRFKWKNSYIAPSALVLLFVFFSILNPRYLSVENVTNILRQSSSLFVLATGVTFVILIGSIDLSGDGVVTLGGVTSVIVAQALIDLGWISAIIALLSGIGVGVFIGALNGTLVTRLKLPSFLVTLGVATVCKGISLIITNGSSFITANKAFKTLGSGDLWIVPIIGIIAISVLLIAVLVLSRTKFGRHIYALGGGERVAELCGVPTRKIRTIAFILAGALAGMAGGLLGARLGAGTNVMGDGMSLDAIAAVVMGGTSLAGGKGGIPKTIIGVLIMTLIANGLNILGVATYAQILVKGVVVVLAVAASADIKTKEIVK